MSYPLSSRCVANDAATCGTWLASVSWLRVSPHVPPAERRSRAGDVVSHAWSQDRHTSAPPERPTATPIPTVHAGTSAPTRLAARRFRFPLPDLARAAASRGEADVADPPPRAPVASSADPCGPFRPEPTARADRSRHLSREAAGTPEAAARIRGGDIRRGEASHASHRAGLPPPPVTTPAASAQTAWRGRSHRSTAAPSPSRSGREGGTPSRCDGCSAAYVSRSARARGASGRKMLPRVAWLHAPTRRRADARGGMGPDRRHDGRLPDHGTHNLRGSATDGIAG